ncbi:MAG: hypothetical protein FWG20_06470, partial [Candidatus Cloacimonetes bacterium]|nr:hypothetical protein [Candidatus Cloacimonadota bacterium]
QGVVTGVNFENNRAFISEPQGGKWSGIAIDGISNKVSTGDFIEVYGKVSEIMGMTVITNVKKLKVLLQNAVLPEPTNVSCLEALSSEAYEAVLVKITNLTCHKSQSTNFVVAMEDNTGIIDIGKGFMNSLNADYFTIEGQYSYVVGIVNYAYNRFTIHPRTFSDIKPSSLSSPSTSWGRIKTLYR